MNAGQWKTGIKTYMVMCMWFAFCMGESVYEEEEVLCWKIRGDEEFGLWSRLVGWCGCKLVVVGCSFVEAS
tara:strand:+ start:969 stop:1181 length:213 start_codon:yes stop_codon:yes gene_type:complete